MLHWFSEKSRPVILLVRSRDLRARTKHPEAATRWMCSISDNVLLISDGLGADRRRKAAGQLDFKKDSEFDHWNLNR